MQPISFSFPEFLCKRNRLLHLFLQVNTMFSNSFASWMRDSNSHLTLKDSQVSWEATLQNCGCPSSLSNHSQLCFQRGGESHWWPALESKKELLQGPGWVFFGLLWGARIRILGGWKCPISSVHGCLTPVFKMRFCISAFCSGEREWIRNYTWASFNSSATAGRINTYRSLATESVNSSCFFVFLLMYLFKFSPKYVLYLLFCFG